MVMYSLTADACSTAVSMCRVVTLQRRSTAHAAYI